MRGQARPDASAINAKNHKRRFSRIATDQDQPKRTFIQRPVFTQHRSTSATLQAWATQPRGA